MRERKLRRHGTGTAYVSNGRTISAIARSDKSASKGDAVQGCYGERLCNDIKK